MKEILLIPFLISYLLPSYNALAQEISGQVIDSDGAALTGATVYIDGTTIGDVTDNNGEFSFEIKPEINAILIVSFVGYKTLYVENPSSETPYLFKLEEDISILREVKVYNNPFSRKEMMSAFMKQFIGDRHIQRNCIIINEDVIRFRYNPESLTFSAFADKPLNIVNRYLGYNITYNLIKFEVQYYEFSLNQESINSSLFSGTTKFEAFAPTKKLKRRRLKAYQNSSLSFFRALKSGELEENGFRIYHKSYRTKADNLMDFQEVGTIMQVQVKQQKRGFNSKDFVAKIDILYDKQERSSISFFTDEFIIDSYGLHSQFDKILFSGAISEKKMALILPADYGIRK